MFRKTNPPKGATLVELLITCTLFSVFMVISTGLFADMTRVVRTEQTPAETILEGRLAALKLCRRVRNCRGMIAPTVEKFLAAPTATLMLRDQVEGKSVDFRVEGGVLSETLYPLDYNPEKAQDFKPIKRRRLCKAQSLRVTSGRFAHPTRVTVEITLTDGRVVRSVTNFREAI